MTNPMIRIHDISTDTIIDREMTDKEFAQFEADEAAYATAQAAQVAKATQKQAVLDRLGLTAEEARLLLGGN
jgi:hypothetical protein